MKIDDYQNWTEETYVGPTGSMGTPGKLDYLMLGLIGEAGELANKHKKLYRDNNGLLTIPKAEELAQELGDIQYYIAQIALVLGYTMEEILELNKSKLVSRMNRGTIHGDGDRR